MANISDYQLIILVIYQPPKHSELIKFDVDTQQHEHTVCAIMHLSNRCYWQQTELLKYTKRLQ